MGNRFFPVIAGPQGRCNPEKGTGSPWTLRVLATTFLLFCASLPAAAQVPGDACATAQQYIVNGGPETLGVVHLMVCQGGTWKSILSANALAEVTKIGNQTCANGDYFKYDGTKFICTTGSGVSGAIDDLTDAYADYVTTNNLIMGRPGAVALTTGAVGNTFIGDLAGATTANSTSTTDYNTAVGWMALYDLTSGRENSAFGESALRMTTTGEENVAFGTNALNDNTTGSNNTAFGDEALWANKGKIGSTAIGYRAMRYADSTAGGGSTYNTAVGAYALEGSGTAANNTGIANTAIGHRTLAVNTSGSYNAAIGQSALIANTTGNNNNAVGKEALSANTTGSFNTAMGDTALRLNTTGNYNTAFGNGAINDNTTGLNNTAVGNDALLSNKAKRESTAIGFDAMRYADDTASGAVTYNTAVGAYALHGSATAANNTGTSNTAIGHSALMANTSGSWNTAVGNLALYSNTSGSYNIAIGQDALYSGVNSTDHNVAIGKSALELVNGSDFNVAVGSRAGDSITTGSGNILIGYDVDTPANNTSNHLNIGGTIFGDVSTDNVRIGGSGTVGAGPLIANPPTAEVIAAAATIAANACGTVKQISATANRTTNTTDTFTAPTASYAGCCMDVVNVDTVDTITLDQNAKFFTGSGGDVSLAPGKGVRVCSDGTSWYQAGGVSSASGGSAALSGLTAASGSNSINNGDNAQVWNWQLTTTDKDAFTFTENTASTATGHSSILKAATLATSTATPLMVTNLGTANSFIVNDETGDNDTSPFVIQNDGDVGIGTANPGARLHVYESGNIPGRIQIEGPTTDQQSSELLLVTSGDSSTVLGGGGAMRGWSLEGVGQSNATTAHRNDFNIAYYDGSAWNHHFWIDNAGSVGIGTTTPTYKLSLDGEAAQTIGMEREQTAATAGRDLTIQAGGAVSGGTNRAGGNLILKSGQSTGNAASNIYFSVYNSGSPGAGSSDASGYNVARFSGAGLDMRYGTTIEWNTKYNDTESDYYEFGSETAFQLWHDSSNDLFRIQAAPPGVSGNSITFNDSISINGTGSVAIGSTQTTLAAKFVVAPPTAQVVAAAATITANACGTVKQISATANRTTNTTDTFTAPTASYAGCCMDVVNVDTVDTITLDQNAKFLTGSGGDVSLAPGKGVRVCSNGTSWYQAGGVSSASGGGGGTIDDLTDAFTDYATNHNLTMGRAAAGALFAGAQYNTFVGEQAGPVAGTNASMDNNTALGYQALTNLTSGESNTALGYWAMRDNQGGWENVAIGGYSLYQNITGNNNVAVGYGSLSANTAGYQNVAVGQVSLAANVANYGSTAIGYSAMRYADDSAGGIETYNTAVGAYALQGSGTPANNTGTNNTALGHSALAGATSGSGNTALGSQALGSNTSGNNNIAIGYEALSLNTSQAWNIAIGGSSLAESNGGIENVAIGVNSGRNILSGSSNVAIGSEAMKGISGTKLTGSANTAIGYNAGLLLQGAAANNTFVGNSVGNTTTTGASNILIGSGITAPTATTSNHLNIGNTIYGDLSNDYIGIGTNAPARSLDVVGKLRVLDTANRNIELSSSASTNTNKGGLIVGARYNNANTPFSGFGTWDNSSVRSLSIGGGGWNVPDANVISFYTAPTYTESTNTAVERMLIDPSGNVGIGTTTPQDKLDIYGGNLRISGSSGAVAISRYNPSGANQDMAFDTSYGEVMRLTSGGGVGIGTPSPNDGAKPHKFAIEDDVTVGSYHDDVGQLQIRGTAGSSNSPKQLTLGVNTDAVTSYGWIQSSQNGTASRALSLNPDGGFVGIGTATPNVRLEVAGTSGEFLRLQPSASGATFLKVNDSSGSPIVLLGWEPNTVSGISSGGFLGNGTNGFMRWETGNDPIVVFEPGVNVGFGATAPQSAIHVPDGDYAQFEDNNAGAPPGADCDANAERGRMSIDTTNNRLYICNGATRGWDYVALTD